MRKNSSLMKFIFIMTSLVVTNSSSAQEIKGQVNITYDNLFPAHIEGHLCQDVNDEDCKNFAATCKELYASLLNTTANINYDINTVSFIQKVDYIYNGENLKLSSMGLSDKYGFISRSIPSALKEKYGIKNVFFVIDKEFKNFSSHFLFNSALPNQKFQCILSGKMISP